MNTIGYIRVSTGRQAESGLGMDAQRRAILAECERRGWSASDVTFIHDQASGSNAKRPGLERAREALAAGKAGALVVHKMDRLSRSLIDFANIMQSAQDQGWALIALDVPVDLTTPIGEALATIIATFSQLERAMISQRTVSALSEARERGTKLGRPKVLDDSLVVRVVTEQQCGRTLRQIASALNHDGVKTAHGGKEWRASSVRGVLKSAALRG